MNLRRTLTFTSAVAAVAAGFAPTAFAQTGQGARVAEDDAIVVTARKREESLLEVPISVSSFSDSVIEDRLITNTTDLAAFTPGLQFNEAFGRDGDRPVIRGASNILISGDKVGLFIDGAPVLGDSSAIDLRSFQRVEIIKGPQSAVFGRGTLAGAINYVSQRPGDDWEFSVEGTYGNYGRADLYASAIGPISFVPGLGAQLSYGSTNFDGDYNNRLAPGGERLGAQSSETFNVAVFYDPTDTLSFTARYMNVVDDDGHFAVALLPATANNCFLATRPTFCGQVDLPETYSINVADIREPGLRRETERGIFTANWDILGSGYEATYQFTVGSQSEVSGYDQSYDGRTFQLSPAFAACVVPVPNRICGRSPFNDTSGGNDYYRTHELRLDSPGDRPFRFNLGYFKLDLVRKPDYAYIELTASGADAAGSRSATDSQSFFGGVEFDFTEKLTFGAELRYQEDTISDRGLPYRVGAVIPVLGSNVVSPNPNAIVGTATFRETTFDAVLPRITISYALEPDVNLYAQYSVGNAPGGFNNLDAPQTTFDEEELTNYEFGVKTSALGFDYLNLAWFYNQYSNQVLTSNYTSGTAQTSYRTNVGEQDIYGFELDLQRELFEGFTLAATYAWIDAQFSSGFESQQALFEGGAYCASGSQPNINLTTPAVTVGGVPPSTSCRQLASVEGNQPPLVANSTASLSGRYERPFGENSTLFVGADLTYRGSFYAQVDNLQSTGAATRLNAQFGVERGGLKVTVWGRNLTNNETPEGILRYVDFNHTPRPPLPAGFQGTPRAFALSAPRKPAFGLTLSYDW